MTPEEHNKYISWTFLANGVFQLVMLAFVLVFMFLWLRFAPGGSDFSAGFFAFVFGFASIINLVLLSPNFVAYYALKNRKPWARIASIVAAVLSAMNVPVGTAACVYALWFFFGDEWKAIYAEGQQHPDPRYLGSNEQPNWEGRFVRQDGEVVYRPAELPNWR